MMARTVRASSSRSTPAMPRQMAAGAIWRSPIAVAITSCSTFSTASSPAVWRFAPGPRPSERIRPCSSASRQTVLRAARVDAEHVHRSDDLIARAALRIYLVSCAWRFGTLARPERCPHGADLGRLSRHRRLPRRHHRLRLLFRALPEDHPRLLPDRPLGAVVGDLLHRRRDRDEHAHLHQRPGDRLRGEHDVSAARRSATSSDACW